MTDHVPKLYFQFPRSCNSLLPNTPSGVYKIQPLPNIDPILVYCEMSTGVIGKHNRYFNFLPRSITRRPDAQQIINTLFTDRKNVLIKLQKKVDRSEAYTLIEPHPNFAHVQFELLVNSHSRVHRILSWETISSSGFFLHRLLGRKTSKASNPTGTASSSETATQIQTACSLSCQTMICRHQVATIQIWFTKGQALLWTGVKPLRRSRVLIAWCQMITSSWQSCTLGAAAVTHPVTAGVNLAFMRLRLEFAKTVSCVTVLVAGITPIAILLLSLC